jgi:SAM-dependent methyltransferase
MTAANYESQWWGYIYDQMMATGLAEWLESNRRFYQANLADVTGPVLECACGTGLFLLPLLAAGHDLYGFDVSQAMLATLRCKAAAQGVTDIDQRVSVQAFETFHYDQPFAAIIIPSNTFVMLTTQEAQIRTLRNIHAHLAPEGRLLLDFRLAGLRDLADAPELIEGRWHTWTHPETGLPIRQRLTARHDFNNQLVLDHCFIEYEDERTDFPMTGRWIFKEEFQLLLRLGGFQRWEYFGAPKGDPLVVGLEETYSYWIAYR